MGYSHAFLVAAAAHATAANYKGVDGEVDGMVCVIAPQNAVVGATKVLRKDHAAVKSCLDEAKDLKDVRDMLTHFDDYATGTGNRQKSLDGVDGPFGWMPMWNSPETILILNRRKVENEARYYGVLVHKALKSVAALVAAADVSLNLKPTLLLETLTKAE